MKWLKCQDSISKDVRYITQLEYEIRKLQKIKESLVKFFEEVNYVSQSIDLNLSRIINID